jgi:hypothetical protein
MEEMNNINPSIWGPSGWKFLHYITLGFPDKPSVDTQKKYIDFFTALQNVLPCENCQLNYKNELGDLGENVGSSDELVKWLINVHNKVNVNTGKKLYSYDEFQNEYIFRTDRIDKLNMTLFMLLVLLIILLSASLFYNKITMQQFLILVSSAIIVGMSGRIIVSLIL